MSGLLGTILAPVASNTLQGIIGSLLNRGARQTQNQAAQGQLDLARVMGDIFRRQADQDLPFRADVMQALRQRAGQQRPLFLPQQAPAINPLTARIRARIPQSGPLPTPGGQRIAPQAQHPLNALVQQILTQGNTS